MTRYEITSENSEGSLNEANALAQQYLDFQENPAYEATMRNLARRQIAEKGPQLREGQDDRDTAILYALSTGLEDKMQQNLVLKGSGHKQISASTFAEWFQEDDITWVPGEISEKSDFALDAYQGQNVYRLSRLKFDGPIETMHEGETVTVHPDDVEIWRMSLGKAKSSLDTPDHLYDACENNPEISRVGNELKRLLEE